jgi:hypothetical protein
MKILFLLDITNDTSKITVPNGRALEVLPHQLQLKQTGPGETWIAFPGVDERGYNPESNRYVPLVRFPVALKPPKRDKQVGEEAPAKKSCREEVDSSFPFSQRPLRVDIRVPGYVSHRLRSCLSRHLSGRASGF